MVLCWGSFVLFSPTVCKDDFSKGLDSFWEGAAYSVNHTFCSFCVYL